MESRGRQGFFPGEATGRRQGTFRVKYPVSEASLVVSIALLPWPVAG